MLHAAREGEQENDMLKEGQRRGNREKKGFTWTETEMDAKMQEARMRTQAVQTVNPTL